MSGTFERAVEKVKRVPRYVHTLTNKEERSEKRKRRRRRRTNLRSGRLAARRFVRRLRFFALGIAESIARPSRRHEHVTPL